ncbi:MICAL-like protein [Achlya hypogyna]|uniref:MICAL-like protein n=1 Tax=Achlya hypogyna TaxID=1202772 RepID=A0A1V9ZJM1_ACHHY|nr:MICAL-like protein [Achlya hypogyna]
MADDNPRVRALFDHLDGGKDGRLCVDDLVRAVRGMPLATAWQLVAEMDSIGDGCIPYAAFAEAFDDLLQTGVASDDQFTWTSILHAFEAGAMLPSPSSTAPPSLPSTAPPSPVATTAVVDKHTALAREISRRRSSKKDIGLAPEAPTSNNASPTHVTLKSSSVLEDTKTFQWPPPASERPKPRRPSLVKSASDGAFPQFTDSLVSVPTYGASTNVALVVAKRSASQSPRARTPPLDTVASLQASALEKLEAIRAACMAWSEDQRLVASKVDALLTHIETLVATKRLPAPIGNALRGFDKAGLAPVGDRQHATVSIQQVQQATKIRAFRKQVLPQLFPNVPDHVATLTELFPDLLPDTIAQMYAACAQDLTSCFEVLSGLSDYTVLEKQLSPKQETFELRTKNSYFSESDSDDDLTTPPFAVAGCSKHLPETSGPQEPVDEPPIAANTFFVAPPAPMRTGRRGSQLSDELKDALAAAMVRFESSQDFAGIMEGFSTLTDALGIDTTGRRDIGIYPLIKRGLKKLLTFRQSRIFEILDAKQKSHALYKQRAAAARRVCIVGAGPVGLRTAIELALLGAEVVVLEKRPSFTRENILHLFPWVVHDLTSLGAKAFYSQFCTSSVYFHVGTRQLQCILLKVALLLGVTVLGSTSFDGVSPTADGYAVATTPPLPPTLQLMTAVVGAGGMYDTVGALANIQRIAFSPSPAYGVLGWVPNTRTKEESQVTEFSWGYQYNQKMFGELRELGLDLENAVYYRGEVHYVVMTPKAKNLLEQGVLKTNQTPLVHPDNIDPVRLRAFVTKAFEFFKIPMKAPLQGANVFDFSRTLRAEKACDILQDGSTKLFVALVGDALMEPFWPQGLGINRGFLSALDTAYAITQLDTKADAVLLAEREAHYKRSAALQLDSNIQKYTIEPASRYGAL